MLFVSGWFKSVPSHKLDPGLPILDGAQGSRPQYSVLFLFMSVVHCGYDDIACGPTRPLLCLWCVSDQLFSTIAIKLYIVYIMS